MLEKGNKYPVIVKFLKAKSFILSTTSVMRHNMNHRLASQTTKSKPSKKTKKKSTKKKRKKLKPAQTTFGDTHKQREERNKAAFERDMKEYEARRKKVLKNVIKLEEDINIMEELSLTVQLAKDRMFRAIEEEIDTKMVIPTTSHAIKDHINALKVYTETSSGMSKTEFNFAQMVNIVGNIFSLPELSDKAKAEMLDVMEQFDISDSNPLPEVIDITEEEKAKPQVVQILSNNKEQKKEKG
jgi:hypothetical protein